MKDLCATEEFGDDDDDDYHDHDHDHDHEEFVDRS